MNNFFLPGTSIIKGSELTWGDLPTPVSNYTNQLWYVSTGSGGLFSAFGAYKYPKGLYSPNATSTAWEHVPINVKVAEDSTTLVNITNWTEFVSYAFDVAIGDRVIYNNSEYKNLTGSLGTAPDTDTLNWESLSLFNVLTVAKSGGQYTSIKDALDSITDASATNLYTIYIGPGVYVENNPIQLQAYVGLVGSAKYTTQIEPLNPNTDLFTGANFATLDNMTLAFVTGATNYAVNMAVPGEILIQNVSTFNCSNGYLINNAVAVMDIVDVFFLTDVASTITGIKVSSGRVETRYIKVLGLSDVGTIIDIDGSSSSATLASILSYSPNVDCICCLQNGANVAGGGIIAQNALDGIVVLGTNTNVDLSSNQIINIQNDGFRIENTGTNIRVNLFTTNITGSGNLNFNIQNANSITTGGGFTELSQGYIEPGAGFYASIIDIVEGDEGLNILGELHVGSSTIPSESVFGRGDSHTHEYVYTFDGVSTYTDRTEQAISFSGSTFAFDGVTAGNAIYIANRFPLKFEGVKIEIDTAATIGAGEIVAEYWNGSTWIEFNGCTVSSTPGFLKFAKNYFSQSGSYHIKYDPFIRDNWVTNDPPTLGTNYYWMRYRIATAITTSPTIQQIKIHTDRAEINTDGTIEFHMDARVYKKLVVDAIRPVEGSMQNADIYVDENVGVGLENNRYTTSGDLLGFSFELPEDCDTSAPLIFVWKGKFATTGDVNFTVRRKIVAPGDAYTNTEPVASGETLTLTTGLITIAAANVREDFRVDIDISDAIPSRNNGFGDEIWITLQYPTRGAGNFDYTKLSANYLSDFAGRHIRQ